MVVESKKLKTSYEFQPRAVKEPKIQAFLDENEIKVTLGSKVYPTTPVFKFKHLALPDSIASKITFKVPTPIQSISWPLVLDNKDLIGIASTGSGKTLAFGIPGILKIHNSPKSQKPQMLILSPTRELAMQIQDQLVPFINSICIYGGVPKHEQKALLRRGTSAIVATPGRLIDLLQGDADICDLSEVKYLVLDEADRMLDQGFEEAIKTIIGKLPTSAAGRQTVMFSATWPPSIQKMANVYLHSAVKVTVGSTDLSANVRIKQVVEVLDPYAKEDRLIALLKVYHKSRTNRILIFALYKKEASRLEQAVRRAGFVCAAIHGDLTQIQRTQAIEGFKSGKIPLLIATDVAARGIDIPNVEYVINVTFPLTVEDYCHRIGRTGRAGKSGISHTFFTLHDKAHSGALINVLKGANQEVPDSLFQFGTTVKKKVDPNYGAFCRDIDPNVKGTKITFDD